MSAESAARTPTPGRTPPPPGQHRNAPPPSGKANGAPSSPPAGAEPAAAPGTAAASLAPRRSEQFLRLAGRVAREAAKQRATEARMEKLIEADRQERTRRERRRALLVGTWMLSTSRARFVGSERDEAFGKWLSAAAARRVDVPLFEEGADFDLLDQPAVDALLAQAAAEFGEDSDDAGDGEGDGGGS